MWGACPTLFDPTQAPPGRHTAFMWEKLPYRLNGDAANWDGACDEHGRAMLAQSQRLEEAVGVFRLPSEIESKELVAAI